MPLKLCEERLHTGFRCHNCSNSVSSNVASATGTQQLEVEQEELLQDELLKREYGEEWVMLEEEADEETYHSEEGEEHDELNEQCMMNHVG